MWRESSQNLKLCLTGLFRARARCRLTCLHILWLLNMTMLCENPLLSQELDMTLSNFIVQLQKLWIEVMISLSVVFLVLAQNCQQLYQLAMKTFWTLWSQAVQVQLWILRLMRRTSRMLPWIPLKRPMIRASRSVVKRQTWTVNEKYWDLLQTSLPGNVYVKYICILMVRLSKIIGERSCVIFYFEGGNILI